MDLQTAVAILNQQVQQVLNIVGDIKEQAALAEMLSSQENSIPNPESQIKSLMASMSIQMTALNSQDVIVQQYIDKISEILASAPVSAS